MSELNPLLWKQEHRIALWVAAGIGGVLGLVRGISSASPFLDVCPAFYGVWFTSVWCRHGVLFPLLGWPVFGALLGAAIVYVWGLMRA
jgi:hypothetical protein